MLTVCFWCISVLLFNSQAICDITHMIKLIYKSQNRFQRHRMSVTFRLIDLRTDNRCTLFITVHLISFVFAFALIYLFAFQICVCFISAFHSKIIAVYHPINFIYSTNDLQMMICFRNQWFVYSTIKPVNNDCCSFTFERVNCCSFTFERLYCIERLLETIPYVNIFHWNHKNWI